jgi:hypothetical protein
VFNKCVLVYGNDVTGWDGKINPKLFAKAQAQ